MSPRFGRFVFLAAIAIAVSACGGSSGSANAGASTSSTASTSSSDGNGASTSSSSASAGAAKTSFSIADCPTVAEMNGAQHEAVLAKLAFPEKALCAYSSAANAADDDRYITYVSKNDVNKAKAYINPSLFSGGAQNVPGLPKADGATFGQIAGKSALRVYVGALAVEIDGSKTSTLDSLSAIWALVAEHLG